jgi:hypothetical protein
MENTTNKENSSRAINALRERQSASGEELSALMPSILDKAFKGEL